MAVWRLIKEPICFVATVLMAKYFHNTSIWKAPSSTPKYVFQTSFKKIEISQSCHLRLLNVTLVFGLDWRNIYDHFKTNSDLPCPKIDSDLWQDNSKGWDARKISNSFDDSFENQIRQIPIINADFNDEMCWIHTSSASCTTKSA